MLIVEIANANINTVGCCPTGTYSYTVKVNRRVITTGVVENHDSQKHWTLLLAKIVKDGMEREFQRVMEIPEL